MTASLAPQERLRGLTGLSRFVSGVPGVDQGGDITADAHGLSWHEGKQFRFAAIGPLPKGW